MGVLFVLGLEEAEITINEEEPQRVPKADLEVFIGRIAADKLKIRQPLHTVRTDRFRHSVLFAEDTAPPIDRKIAWDGSRKVIKKFVRRTWPFSFAGDDSEQPLAA